MVLGLHRNGSYGRRILCRLACCLVLACNAIGSKTELGGPYMPETLCRIATTAMKRYGLWATMSGQSIDRVVSGSLSARYTWRRGPLRMEEFRYREACNCFDSFRDWKSHQSRL